MANEKILDPITNKPAKGAAKAAMSEARAAAEQTAATVETNVETLTNAAQETVRRTQETARRTFDEAVTVTKQGLDQAAGRMFQNLDQFSAFGKENVDAVVKSSQALTKGVEELSRQVLGYAQQAIEMNVNATRALMGVKSLREFADVQNDLTKTGFDTFVQESTKLSEMAIKTTSEAFEPINSRATAVFETFSRARAA